MFKQLIFKLLYNLPSYTYSCMCKRYRFNHNIWHMPTKNIVTNSSRKQLILESKKENLKKKKIKKHLYIHLTYNTCSHKSKLSTSPSISKNYACRLYMIRLWISTISGLILWWCSPAELFLLGLKQKRNP